MLPFRRCREFCFCSFRSDVALSMLLLLNRISQDDIQQAARIFGEGLGSCFPGNPHTSGHVQGRTAAVLPEPIVAMPDSLFDLRMYCPCFIVELRVPWYLRLPRKAIILAPPQFDCGDHLRSFTRSTGCRSVATRAGVLDAQMVAQAFKLPGLGAQMTHSRTF